MSMSISNSNSNSNSTKPELTIALDHTVKPLNIKVVNQKVSRPVSIYFKDIPEDTVFSFRSVNFGFGRSAIADASKEDLWIKRGYAAWSLTGKGEYITYGTFNGFVAHEATLTVKRGDAA